MRCDVVALRRGATAPKPERPAACTSRLRDALCAGRVDEFIEETLVETAPPRAKGNVVGLLRAMGGRVSSPLSSIRRLAPRDGGAPRSDD